jgi:hypothetical protein
LLRRTRHAVGPKARLHGLPATSPYWARLHEPRSDFRRVGLPSRASLLLPSRNRLTDRDSSHGLLLPYSTYGIEGPHLRTACRPIAGASLRVWLPSRRFTPFDASPVLFHTSSAHGIHPSELSPRERHLTVSRRKNPRTVSRSPRAPEGNLMRAGNLGFWALLLSRVPGDQARD